MTRTALQEWIKRHDADIPDRDLVAALSLPFILLKSSGEFKTVYLSTGLIVDSTDAEIMLWFACKTLGARCQSGSKSESQAALQLGGGKVASLLSHG